MRVLEGQVVIITGASGGIGKVICKVLAMEGVNIAAHYLKDRDGIETAAALVKGAGRQVEVIKADLTIPSDVTFL